MTSPSSPTPKSRIENPKEDLPIVCFRTVQKWSDWLEKNHSTAPGLWLQIAKKDTETQSVSYGQALEVALCFGWIDGQKQAYDDCYWLQRFTPRKPRSRWSKINRVKAEELIKQKKMKPSGMQEIKRAQDDGRWKAAYDGQRIAEVPDDLQSKLDGHPVAKEFFATLNRANRYAILYRIQDAKRAETRARRIEKFVAMLDEHKTIHPLPSRR